MPASTKRAGSVDPLTPHGPSRADLDQAARLIESERAQIGHEIHDGLLPLIFAASATLSSILDRSHPVGSVHSEPSQRPAPDSPAANNAGDPLSEETFEKLQQVSAWLTDAMQVGRLLLTNVYPPDLVGSLWVRAAKDTISRLFPGTTARIQWQADPQVNEISAAIAVAAYRITVEAVRNAIAHGHANEVIISGRKQANGVEVCIADNGSGFDPSQVPPDRFGIRSMIGRAESIGGGVRIDSQPGGPTTVTFVSHGGRTGSETPSDVQ